MSGPATKPYAREEVQRQAREAWRDHRRRRLFDVAIVTVVALGGFLAFANWPKFFITNLVIEGERVVAEDALRQAVDTQLAGHYAYLVPRRHQWFYSRRGLADALLHNFPRLAAVDVAEREGTLYISVAERKGELTWCRPSETECFVADATGFIFAPAPGENTVYFRLIGELPPAPVGTQPLAPAELATVRRYAEGLERVWAGARFERAVRAVRLAGGTAEFVTSGQPQGFVIRLDLAKAPELALQNLAAALDTAEFQAAATAGLEYVDLRYSPKIFYKTRDAL